MDLSISLQSLKNLFRFPFRDPKWQGKFVIGSALGFASMAMIPIIPTIPLLGYASRIVRAGAANERPNKLPEWNNWSELFIDGLRLLGVIAIGTLPAILVMLIGLFAYIGSSLWFPIMLENAETNGTVFPIIVFVLAVLFFLATMGIGTLLWFISGVLLPPALTHVAVTRKFSSLFKLDEWWKILRSNFLGFLVSLGVLGALYLLMVAVTKILFFTVVFWLLIPLITLPITFYGTIIYSRLIGQVYGEVSDTLEKTP